MTLQVTQALQMTCQSNSYDYPYDGYRCKKFGEVNFITGEIKYDLAAVCRLGDSNCGKKGLHYTAKNQSLERSKDSK